MTVTPLNRRKPNTATWTQLIVSQKVGGVLLDSQGSGNSQGTADSQGTNSQSRTPIVIGTYDQNTTGTSADAQLQSAGNTKLAQSITLSVQPGIIDSLVVSMKKVLAPAGNITASVYNVTGLNGSTAVPSGAALATSATLAISGLKTTYDWYTLRFTGVNRILLPQSFCIGVNYSGGDASNYLLVETETTKNHYGNFSTFTLATWSADTTQDLKFYLMVQDQNP